MGRYVIWPDQGGRHLKSAEILALLNSQEEKEEASKQEKEKEEKVQEGRMTFGKTPLLSPTSTLAPMPMSTPGSVVVFRY